MNQIQDAMDFIMSVLAIGLVGFLIGGAIGIFYYFVLKGRKP